MANKIKVLLTGAGSTLGREILAQLLTMRKVFEISVLDIKRGHTMAFFEKYKKEIHIFYGDCSIQDNTVEACKGQDFVIHCQSLEKANADKRLRLAEDVNTMGTRYIIENLERFSPGAYLLYISTVGVYGDRLKAPMISADNMTCPSMGDYDALTKLQAEKLVQESSLEWTIYRPGIILGHDSSLLNSSVFFMPLATRFETGHIRDLASACVKAYDHKASLWGRTYNVGGGEACRIVYSDYIRRLFKLLGLGYPEFPDRAFATRNRFGGYFADGDALEAILHFRRHTIEDYFKELAAQQPILKKLANKIFVGVQRKSLEGKSAPLRAIKENDRAKKKYYF